MKSIIISYVVCSAALFVAVAFILGGGLWSLCGFVWCGALYVSGVAFPAFWRRFWVANIRILSYFNLL